MFSFQIQADADEIRIPVTRSMLFIGGILVVFSLNPHPRISAILAGLLLLTGGLFCRTLMQRYRLPAWLLASSGALLLLAATGNLMAPLFLLLTTLFLHFSYRKPVAEVDEAGLRIRKTLSRQSYTWHELSNLLIRDRLLTIDFRNNRLLQLEISGPDPDEAAFNRYCAEKIQQAA